MTTTFKDILGGITTSKGNTLLSATEESPVLLVFLRHFGCIFCMEAMKDLAKRRNRLEAKGVRIIMVHMAHEQIAEEYFKEYDLEGVEHISDPDCRYYEAFGLLKGTFGQLYGLQVWLRTAENLVKDRRAFMAKRIGDGIQMPGVFYITDGEIKEKYIHSKVSDRPDYEALVDCCAV